MTLSISVALLCESVLRKDVACDLSFPPDYSPLVGEIIDILPLTQYTFTQCTEQEHVGWVQRQRNPTLAIGGLRRNNKRLTHPTMNKPTGGNS